MSSDEDFIAAKMGQSKEGFGIAHEGRDLVLGVMTPAQAAAHVAKLEKEMA
jgi:hypothetical protein